MLGVYSDALYFWSRGLLSVLSGSVDQWMQPLSGNREWECEEGILRFYSTGLSMTFGCVHFHESSRSAECCIVFLHALATERPFQSLLGAVPQPCKARSLPAAWCVWQDAFNTEIHWVLLFHWFLKQDYCCSPTQVHLCWAIIAHLDSKLLRCSPVGWVTCNDSNPQIRSNWLTLFEQLQQW